jgi:hypothetical protein
VTLTVAGPPTPEENAEILRNSANLRVIASEDRRTHRPYERDLILSFQRHRLLFAAGDDRPRVEHGPDGRLLLAFTDEEAAQAWAQQRHPADTAPVTWTVFPGAGAVTGRGAGREWAAYLDEVAAQVVVVNSAGPNTEYLLRRRMPARPRLLQREIPGDAEPWLDVDARAVERAHSRKIHREFNAAVEARDNAALDALRTRFSGHNRLHNMLLEADHQTWLGRWRLQNDHFADGALGLVSGSIQLGRHGDPLRSIDSLLLSAELLLPLLEGENEIPDEELRLVRWQAARIGAAFEPLVGGYRAEEVVTVRARLPAVESTSRP